MTKDNTELKSCPFCGLPATSAKYNGAVICDGGHNFTMDSLNTRQIDDAWNTRTPRPNDNRIGTEPVQIVPISDNRELVRETEDALKQAIELGKECKKVSISASYFRRKARLLEKCKTALQAQSSSIQYNVISCNGKGCDKYFKQNTNPQGE